MAYLAKAMRRPALTAPTGGSPCSTTSRTEWLPMAGRSYGVRRADVHFGDLSLAQTPAKRAHLDTKVLHILMERRVLGKPRAVG